MTVEYYTSDGHEERLSALAADVIRRRPAAIMALGTDSAFGRQSVDARDTNLFFVANDPVEVGLVARIILANSTVTTIVLQRETRTIPIVMARPGRRLKKEICLRGIVPFENAEVAEMRNWTVDHGDIRGDTGVAREILEFMEKHGVLSLAMTDGIIGCPHQQGIDYEGECCPVCEFWRGRDRFTGQRAH